MLRGSYYLELNMNDNLLVPKQLYSQFSKLNDTKTTIDEQLIHMIPNGNSVMLLPNSTFSGFQLNEHVQQLNWDNDIAKVLVNKFPLPSTPWFSEKNSPLPLDQARELLNYEIKKLKGTSSQKGRQVEKILKEILLAMGVFVEANVRVMGSEIDLMLCRYNKLGKVQYTIIELKFRESKATISQVLRLFGLQEALRTKVDIPNSLIANISGYTSNSEAMIKQVGISGIGIDELFDWVDSYGLNNNKETLPFVKSTSLSAKGEFALPAELKGHFSKKLLISGIVNLLELWNAEDWEKQLERDLDKIRADDFLLQLPHNSLLLDYTL